VNPFDIFLPVWLPFVTFLETGLSGIADYTNSAGLAIIIFTIGLKLLLTPFSLMQTKSMKAMQALQPEIAALKKKYPKDRERLAQEQMRLYKEYGVNPAAGCLPMIPMMIVLIALYQALIHLSCDPNAVNAGGAACDPNHLTNPLFQSSWLWISSLGHPDVVAHIGTIPIPGVLPIVMLVSQFAYGRLTPTQGASDDPQQQMMQKMTTFFMPLMLFFFSFNFPAGLVLYWTISNTFEIFRMGFMVSWDPLRPANLLAGLTGRTPPIQTAALPETSLKRPSEPRDDEDDDEPVNPPPGRPPGGSRKKKGKRGGKR
jgi:YidC/Oxa1 family membrane protein insertase